MNPWIAFVPGLVLGILLGALLFRRARRRETVVPAAGPAPSVADPSRGIFIPGRNFPEMMERLGSDESLLDVILNGCTRAC